MSGAAPQTSEVMVIDTIQEVAPGVVEVDEYVVGAGSGGFGQGGPGQGGGHD